ncbi:unnamed protein product [Phytophthora lilii]|uniref:Unnamed protein product n=1 Tax=Phytophthora lilii TaxID=2077276 RepID=A0A9W6WMF9_9STRA|nr:unnamed protein product [Phytophthora lilii]
MKQRARRHLVTLLLIVLCFLYVAEAVSNDLWTKCVQNVPRSFTESQQAELCTGSRSSNHLRQDPMMPGQCAKLALGGRALQSPKFASRLELLRAASIIQLCSGAQNTGPATCWLAVPNQLRQQMLLAAASPPLTTEFNVESAASALPLVQICRRALDDRPAKCLLVWLEMSKSLRKQDAHDALEIAAPICTSFDGQVTALKQCVKLAAPHLRIGAGSEISVFQLCQLVGDGMNLPALVECTLNLRRKHISPSTIAQVCVETSRVAGIQPHTCFLGARQKLRWMDEGGQVTLCKDASAYFASVPVTCASEMKNTARMLLSSNPASSSSTEELSILVANLCRSATNASSVNECVRLLPVHAFTVSQAIRLCAASTMPTKDLEEETSVAFYPTSCASEARLLLQRSVLVNASTDLGMSPSAAAVQICEQATSNAPSQCLADTQHDQALSAKRRMHLCKRAKSDAPQQCAKSLRKFVSAQRLDIDDVVVACRQAESLGSAECVTELLQVAVTVTGSTAAQLCRGARNLEPARCFVASPPFYDDDLKVLLCNQAECSAPAVCVESVITRISNQPSVKVALCRHATTSAPAACAIEAPFGMDEASLIALCRSAVSTAPAKCAHEISLSLGVPWHRVAQVCAGATSSTPGRCLAHHIRHSRLLLRAMDDNQVVRECRLAVAHPAALGIARASYNCPQLRPNCALQLVIKVLDQYGDPVTDNDCHVSGTKVVYVSAVYTGNSDVHPDYIHREQPALQGPSYATISNGSAIFSNLLFTAPGEFTLTFRAGEDVTEEVARVIVHPDLAAEALKARCDELFTRFQCCAQSPPPPRRDYQQREVQPLLLHHSLHLNAILCGQYWLDNIGGLVFSGFSRNQVVYVLSRPLYDLFTSMDVPHAGMSAWALLGLNEGETSRAAIRRAYHRRSLEWHPDKWHILAATLPAAWQQELGGIFALVTQAYDQLSAV